MNIFTFSSKAFNSVWCTTPPWIKFGKSIVVVSWAKNKTIFNTHNQRKWHSRSHQLEKYKSLRIIEFPLNINRIFDKISIKHFSKAQSKPKELIFLSEFLKLSLFSPFDVNGILLRKFVRTKLIFVFDSSKPSVTFHFMKTLYNFIVCIVCKNLMTNFWIIFRVWNHKKSFDMVCKNCYRWWCYCCRRWLMCDINNSEMFI